MSLRHPGVRTSCSAAGLLVDFLSANVTSDSHRVFLFVLPQVSLNGEIVAVFCTQCVFVPSAVFVPMFAAWCSVNRILPRCVLVRIPSLLRVAVYLQ